MKELTSQQRKYLTKEAHSLNPVVMVGQKGLTEGLITMVEETLENHELIKVKFVDYKESRREISEEICQKCSAHLVRVVGNIAIIYRQNDDPAQRRYKP
ncbi:MAG: ribosome assembly RNA-binding protein YhbY [Spirochaetales bacterium]|nr:ribosome assembly RNA-binding protein YhbY [Spirochaetales bacterium]